MTRRLGSLSRWERGRTWSSLKGCLEGRMDFVSKIFTCIFEGGFVIIVLCSCFWFELETYCGLVDHCGVAWYTLGSFLRVGERSWWGE